MSLFNIGDIRPVDLEHEMRTSYMDYAMSVIISRALPDVRDGLKPVQRRILYAMLDQGMTAGARYQKSAAIVGEVLKNYHPHGDSSVYDTMVRLAQDWVLRYPLVDGQGNFGSVDGDSAAAYRYTEARMTAVAMQLVDDIEKNTVEFQDNFSSTTQEPTVLPALIPKLVAAMLVVPRVVADPGPAVQLSQFGANGLELTLVFWIADIERGQGNVRSDINLAVLAALNAEGVEIPLPQQVTRVA